MPVTVTASRVLHRGKVIELVSEDITLDTGITATMEFIRHPGAVAVIPMPDSTHMILLRQYRHALAKFIWEIPAGTLDAHETALQCARRELAEETGHRARHWHRLGEITPVPGYSSERITIFLAAGLDAAEQHPDEDEILEAHCLEQDRVEEMVRRGAIRDAKTLAGFFLLQHWLQENSFPAT